MPKRILLVNANRCTIPDPVFPLGLAFINAALRRARHETLWFDLLSESLASLEAQLRNFRPEIVGISFRNVDNVLDRGEKAFFPELTEVCTFIRCRTDCSIIVGGSGFSIFPSSLLQISGADFGVCGEGETTLVSLVAALENGDDPSRIPGLAFRRDNQVIVNPSHPGSFVGCLEISDLPPRTIQHYLKTGGMLNLQTQRGCPFDCCYCTYPSLEGRQCRRRAADLVAEEMAMLERLGARYVFIVDSVFNSSLAHSVAVCEAILRRGVKVKWGCFLRPQGLTAEVMKIMVRAGLQHVEFGSDSLCDQVLASYGKRISFRDILHSSELARQEQLAYCHFLICGGPGETKETLKRTFENSKLTGGVIMAVAGMRVYPGTPLSARLKSEKGNDESNLLAPTYYITPSLSSEEILLRLKNYSSASQNWIPSDTPPAYVNMVARLRQRNVFGPLWSYYPVTQGLWPHNRSGVGCMRS